MSGFIYLKEEANSKGEIEDIGKERIWGKQHV